MAEYLFATCNIYFYVSYVMFIKNIALVSRDKILKKMPLFSC